MRQQSLLLPGPAALIAVVLAAWLGMSPLNNFDLFFHLAGGRFLLEHGFTRVDPFSITGTAGWVPHEWGFGVACMALIRGLGAGGPGLLIAMLVVANVLLLWSAVGRAASGGRGLLALAVFTAVLLVHAPTWGQERPYHLGHLLFTVAVVSVQAWRAGNTRILWLFPVLGALWANLHGSWPLGPALLGGTALGMALDSAGDRRKALRGLAFAAAAFLAAGLGPDGMNIYLYPFHHSLLPSTQNIVEWRPLDLDLGSSWAYLALFGAALFVVGGAPARRFAILLPTLVLGVAAIKVQRHAPFAAVLMALAILEHSRRPTASEAVKWPWQRLDGALARWSARAEGSLWPALVLLVLATIHALNPLPVEQGVRRRLIPIDALEELRKLPPGKVLNPFVIGGAISFFAGAEYKVFIDSRNDPFPLSIHEDYTRLLWGEPGWEEALARYAPDYLLWNTTNPGNILLDHLRARGGWREVTRDGNYVLWVQERGTAMEPP
ncbi:hypothetical protein [Corallococcus macrosporus]|uniref:Glycosyltransferase RgtA/B/C/D-like domain-containing protein n=1 Tax=Myxococcus fulvus (strain ATCC BAA-855 / HW-1) TaxID=483219 RepID=F8CF05_MYXFH|nr:hypothetical protein [Corallococcus macrosporus]AEI68593.1 hypothetical protein LILAB_33560 [Corallococcus macrosporus]